MRIITDFFSQKPLSGFWETPDESCNYKSTDNAAIIEYAQTGELEVSKRWQI
jgi:hypothetical protein